MADHKYLTSPPKITTMPPGVPYIVGNEAAERFSYYGMNSILTIFMTKYLLDKMGHLSVMQPANAEAWYHTFVSALYFLPIFGAILADAVFGKFRVVFWLSIVYCGGHLTLALMGSPVAHAIEPRYLLAVGLPGVFMALATFIFWLGRKKFVHIPPVGLRTYGREIFNKETGKILLNILIPVPFVAIFWALWQQNFSSWILQAESMDRHLFGIEWLSSQIQTVNPIFILIMLPLFSYWLYPAVEKVVRLTPLRKIGAGLFVTAASFFLVAMIQTRIDAGARPGIIWQVWAFVILTAGETLVSPTHLEFSYTQGPVKLKSLVMCTYLFAVSLGNQFTAAVNFFIQNPDGTVKLQGTSYFMFFVWVMLGTAVLFAIVTPFYKGRTYLQDQAAAPPAAEPAIGFVVQPEA